MAPVSKVLRTCGLLFYLILKVYSEEASVGNPWIVNLELESKQCSGSICNYLLHVRGEQFLGHYSWRLTPGAASVGSDCGELYPNYEIKHIETSETDTRLEIVVPNLNEKIYFCLQDPQAKGVHSRWKYIHQGANLFLDPKNDVVSAKKVTNTSNEKIRSDSIHQNSEGVNSNTTWVDLSHDIDVNYLPNTQYKRKERDNIDAIKDNYIPFNINQGPVKVETFDPHEFEFEDPFNNKIKRKPNGRYRYRREIINDENKSFEEIKTADDIIGPFDDKIDAKIKADENGQQKRQTSPKVPFFTTVRADPVPIVVEGLRIEISDKEPVIIEEGIPSVLAGSAFTLRLFGQGLTRRTVIAFTHDPLDHGQPCKFLVKGEYMVKEDSLFPHTALFELTAPEPINGHKLYVCAKNLKFGARNADEDEEKYIHMGFDTWTMLATHNNLLPLWATLTLIVICLCFSALFSGLNLGLMSLDRTELKIISNTGTDKERKYSRAIMPVRDHGNYLLCSILLGNVAVNSTFTILLDGLTSGLFAVILSTLAIVLLGEITPQAICSRHGLMIGAKTIMITKAVMALTAPMAYPVSKLLDYFLGEEIGSVYNRERLKELVKVTTDVNDLDKDEVNIISGALELRKKTVSDVMTKLEDAFMLPITSILDFETMSEIIKSGYSRIPVYEGSRVNVVTVLFIKDLAFVDPDDNTPLKTLCQYYQNPCNFVFEDVTLDVMFKQFKEGHKGHMAFVHRINNEGEGDPFYETIGLVTLEDVIEEMIQAEIVDETDVFMDNRTKRRRNRPQNKLQDFAAFAERHENQRIHISPQLTLATFQFLSTSVDAFRPDTVSETVLRRLLKQDVIQHIKVKNKSKRDACTYVFQQGKPVDYFVLVLEGRVEVTVGRENLVFEAGPFTYFGVQALTQNIGVAESPTPSAMGSLQNINMDSMLRHTFVPDYSVRAITELYYLTVKRSLYLAAKRATLMEKGALSKGATNEQFDTEVDKSNPAKNTIELMQIPKSKYVSLDNVNGKLYPYNRSNQHLNQTERWPNFTSQSLANTSTKTECWRTLTKSVADFLDTHDDVTSSSNDLANNLDANNCAECLKNNFWIKPVKSENYLPSQPFTRKGWEGEVELTEDDTHRKKKYSLSVRFLHRLKLLQSVDEDISISGEHKTPSRQVSPNPMPVSASPLTRASFARASPDKNGDKPDEQEKLLK